MKIVCIILAALALFIHSFELLCIACIIYFVFK